MSALNRIKSGLCRAGRSLLGPRVIETERLYLRAPRLRDARDMFAFSRDPEVSRFVLWQQHTSEQDARNALRCIIFNNRCGTGKVFAMEDKQTGRMIGSIGFEKLCGGTGEIGYSIARDYWNRGITTEALQAVLRYGFDCLRLRRIEGECVAENLASARVMEKAGMRPEGRVAGGALVHGVQVNTLRFSKNAHQDA